MAAPEAMADSLAVAVAVGVGPLRLGLVVLAGLAGPVLSGSSHRSKPMRFHLLTCPNAQTTQEYSLCGFANLNARFSRMLTEAGHTVYLYASDKNEAPCTELVSLLSKDEITTLLNGVPYPSVWFHDCSQLWNAQVGRAIPAIAKRKHPGDFILTIGGSAHKAVCDWHKDLFAVEYSIGYTGTFAPYRVFESHVHRANVQGRYQQDAGSFFDEVIPVPFYPDEFPFVSEPNDYFAYVGRIVDTKGVALACEVAHRAGVKLKVAGHGTNEDIKKLVCHGAEYVGAPNAQARNELMAHAKAVFTPTLYVEPFNCVAVEAQLCGTPVISTPWGGFTETIQQGVTGFRCTMFREFVAATKEVELLNRAVIRARALSLYTPEVIMPQYNAYFRRVAELKGDGFYAGYGPLAAAEQAAKEKV